MFIVVDDAHGSVCVNMDTGLRFRANRDGKTNVATGVQIIFPDGHTNIVVRGEFERLIKAVAAKDHR